MIYSFDEAQDMPEPEPAPSTREGVMVWVEGTGAWVVEIDGVVMCEPMNGTHIGLWCRANHVTLAYTPRTDNDFTAYLERQRDKKKGRGSS